MSSRRHTKMIRENDLMAEVEVDLVESSDPWSPYLSVEDVRKLDHVRLSLRKGDIASALKFARVYRLTPLASGVVA